MTVGIIKFPSQKSGKVFMSDGNHFYVSGVDQLKTMIEKYDFVTITGDDEIASLTINTREIVAIIEINEEFKLSFFDKLKLLMKKDTFLQG